jgi:hypothetical protein
MKLNLIGGVVDRKKGWQMIARRAMRKRRKIGCETWVHFRGQSVQSNAYPCLLLQSVRQPLRPGDHPPLGFHDNLRTAEYIPIVIDLEMCLILKKINKMI